jgi:hypothetical protein
LEDVKKHKARLYARIEYAQRQLEQIRLADSLVGAKPALPPASNSGPGKKCVCLSRYPSALPARAANLRTNFPRNRHLRIFQEWLL